MRLLDVLDWAIDLGFTSYYNLPFFVLKYFPSELEGVSSLDIFSDLQNKVIASIEETPIEWYWSVEQVKEFFEEHPATYAYISH